LSSFYSAVPPDISRSGLDQRSIASINFWSGQRLAGSVSLSYLYANLVRDEGRDAVSRYMTQIERALQAAKLLQPITTASCSPLFDPYINNRHLISAGNFCLNDDGRALLAALLTLHSSRVGKLVKSNHIPVYQIYHGEQEFDNRGEQVIPRHAELLHPEACITQPGGRKSKEEIYGRYTELFERGDKYTGCIDPISLRQLCYFININGCTAISNDSGKSSVTFKLNAAPARKGITVNMDSSGVDDIRRVRLLLKQGLTMLTYANNESLISGMEKLIIRLWREAEEPVEPNMFVRTNDRQNEGRRAEEDMKIRWKKQDEMKKEQKAIGREVKKNRKEEKERRHAEKETAKEDKKTCMLKGDKSLRKEQQHNLNAFK
ncbi:hypothetical protein PENTCL1PPCAC_20933, partial [Pristionchus entomophagus]